MGQQQSAKQGNPMPSGQVPQSGYRITNLSSQYSPMSLVNKLNIMTDYVIDKDPRLIDLKLLYDEGKRSVQFRVFNVLEYRVRNVQVEIQKAVVADQNKNEQEMANRTAQALSSLNSLQSRKPFTLGIKFKYYPKINDTILRVSRIFKNSPLQMLGIKKDEYIVGILEGDFTSIKQFVQLVKILIESQLEFITLALCDSLGESRLVKVSVKELVKWKETYGVGYLGIELAEGWLNKWELKKSIDENKKRIIALKKNQKHQDTNAQNTQNVSTQQNTSSTQKKQQESKNQPTLANDREEVDFFKQAGQIKHQEEEKSEILNKGQQMKIQEKSKPQETTPLYVNADSQNSKTSLDNMKMLPQNVQRQKETQKVQKTPVPNFANVKLARASQPLPCISSSLAEQQTPSSTSSVSSEQIQQKCHQLNHSSLKSQDTNIIKKTQNILQISYKGILKNQNIDDASTICLCKEYSKHCQKCFKEKDENYYFFNKKTNKIITIQKAMLFPKKN